MGRLSLGAGPSLSREFALEYVSLFRFSIHSRIGLVGPRRGIRGFAATLTSSRSCAKRLTSAQANCPIERMRTCESVPAIVEPISSARDSYFC